MATSEHFTIFCGGSVPGVPLLRVFFVVMSVCRMPNGKEDFGSEFHPMGGPNHHKVHIFG